MPCLVICLMFSDLAAHKVKSKGRFLMDCGLMSLERTIELTGRFIHRTTC